MTIDELKENVLKAEGYAEGFRAGYISCAKKVAEDLAKEQKEVEKGGENVKI